MLRWLRTLSIDCEYVPPSQQFAFVEETLAVQQRSVLPRRATCRGQWVKG